MIRMIVRIYENSYEAVHSNKEVCRRQTSGFALRQGAVGGVAERGIRGGGSGGICRPLGPPLKTEIQL